MVLVFKPSLNPRLLAFHLSLACADKLSKANMRSAILVVLIFRWDYESMFLLVLVA